MSEVTKVSKKLVTVRCGAPFRIGHIPFAGVCNKVTLSVEDICKCIEHKAMVVEHLLNGQEIPLGFDNYNTYNGPTKIDDESTITKFKEPEIEMIDKDKNVTILNKEEEVVEEAADVKHIDLEAINKEKEEQEAQEKAKKEAEEKAAAEKAQKEKQLEEQRKRDEEERKKAMDAVLTREKEASERKNANSGVITVSLKKDDVVAEQKTEPVVEEEKQEVVAAEIEGTLEVAEDNTPATPTPTIIVDTETTNDNDSNNDNYNKKKKKHH